MVVRWLVIASLVIPMVSGTTWDDPEGDQAIRPIAGDSQPYPLANQPQADIIRFALDETINRFVVQISFAGPPEIPAANRNYGYLDFQTGGRNYEVVINPQVGSAVLNEDGRRVANLEARWMFATDEPNTLRFEIPKGLLNFGDDRALTGIQLEVVAQEVPIFGTPANAQDSAAEVIDIAGPSDGTLALNFMPTMNNLAFTGVRNVADTNGEAGVHALNVTLDGTGTAELQLTGPEKYRTAYPQQIDLTNGPTTFPLLIAAPGVHEHGKEDVFWLNATTPTGTATIPLGIHYTYVPYPTGHHNTLYIHQLGPGEYDGSQQGYLSTQPVTDQAPVDPRIQGDFTMRSIPVTTAATYAPPGAKATLDLEFVPETHPVENIRVSLSQPGLPSSTFYEIPVEQGKIHIHEEIEITSGYLSHPEDGWWQIRIDGEQLAGLGSYYAPDWQILAGSSITLDLEDVPPMLQDDPTRTTTNVTAPSEGTATFSWSSPVHYGAAICADVSADDGNLVIGNVIGECEGGIYTDDGVERLWITPGPPETSGGEVVENSTPKKDSPTILPLAGLVVVLLLRRR